jgi:sugar O-acyltransferase (sialic acid O-acetyltransferase NeuD family)
LKKIVIFGAAHFGVVKIIGAINRREPAWEILGFLDDVKYPGEKEYHGLPILGTRDLIPKLVSEGTHFVNNVSGHWTRTRKVAVMLQACGCLTPNIVHPDVDLSYVEMGQGCLLAEGVILGDHVKIGNFVTLRYGCIVSHDVVLEDYVMMAANATASGFSVLKQGCFVGAGATILGQKSILGEGSLVGAGAAVVGPVPAYTTVVGVPARPLKTEDGHDRPDH